MKSFFLLPLLALTACSSFTTYSDGQAEDDKGNMRAVAVKRLQTYGDIVGPFKVNPDGSIEVQDPQTVHYSWTAIVDGKGNPILDKDGKPIYNTIAVTAGLKNSDSTLALFRGLSLFVRSLSNLFGTVISGIFGAEAVSAGAGAIGTAIRP